MRGTHADLTVSHSSTLAADEGDDHGGPCRQARDESRARKTRSGGEHEGGAANGDDDGGSGSGPTWTPDVAKVIKQSGWPEDVFLDPAKQVRCTYTLIHQLGKMHARELN